jgi:sporulation protein YlmC with PRC-barrel domain
MSKSRLPPIKNTAMEKNNLTDDDLTGTNHGPLFVNSPLKYLTASSIIGDKVHNEADEKMGEIKDIMIDVVTGKIDYFIVEFGGFLGVGKKYFAIPFRVLRVDPENKRYIFNQQKTTLEQAPGFDIDHWPHTNIHLDQVYSYWSFMG